MKKKTRRIVKRLLTAISPKLETIINYRYSCGEWLCWKDPQDLNAIICKLKVTDYYNNPLITQCVDKYRVREWVCKNVRGGDSLFPTLYGIYETPEDINWEELPDQVVIKCNHGCGMNYIIKDKRQIDVSEINKTLLSWLKIDYWKEGEVQYRNVEKRIIAEEYLGGGSDLKTIKFFCFNGIPQFLYVSLDEDLYIDYYDMDFNKLPYSNQDHKRYPGNITKPKQFELMKSIASEISCHFPFVRVDLYDSFGRVYVSELTFVPTGGYMRIEPPEVLKEWGNLYKVNN